MFLRFLLQPKQQMDVSVVLPLSRIHCTYFCIITSNLLPQTTGLPLIFVYNFFTASSSHMHFSSIPPLHIHVTSDCAFLYDIVFSYYSRKSPLSCHCSMGNGMPGNICSFLRQVFLLSLHATSRLAAKMALDGVAAHKQLFNPFACTCIYL